MDLSQKRVSFIRFYVLFLLVYFLVFIGNGPSVQVVLGQFYLVC